MLPRTFVTFTCDISSISPSSGISQVQRHTIRVLIQRGIQGIHYKYNHCAQYSLSV